MAVTIEDLLNRKEEIQRGKKQQFDLETSIGTITVRMPKRSEVLETRGLKDSDSDGYLIYQTVVEPDLSNRKLQQAYGCGEPTDIVTALFLPGEIPTLAVKIMELAGFSRNIESKVHEDLKN